DSHTNLGAMTNVRLDSFVYTVEGFREAVACLKPGGLVVVSYLVMDQSQADKLFGMLQESFPQLPPRVFTPSHGLVFVTGPGRVRLPEVVPGAPEVTKTYQARAAGADLATDDWPYFYMQKRTYPVTYAVMIALLLATSAWMVRRNLGGFRLGTAHSG